MKKIFAYGIILMAVSLFVLGCQPSSPKGPPVEKEQPVAAKDALAEEETSIDNDLAEIDALSKDLDAATEDDISAQLEQI
ncbi:MAG TPA: hypothetical protein VJG31_01370 [Candidatus Nanoarchaeia archaeon]|nr:hypothetical protein [Candidatus Nanoarchaeia archaeon]